MDDERWRTVALPLLKRLAANEDPIETASIMDRIEADNTMFATLVDLIEAGYIQGASVFRASGRERPLLTVRILRLTELGLQASQ
jgi:hypothetical protein